MVLTQTSHAGGHKDIVNLFVMETKSTLFVLLVIAENTETVNIVTSQPAKASRAAVCGKIISMCNSSEHAGVYRFDNSTKQIPPCQD